METTINFIFREKHYSASYVICEREYPTYIYVPLKDDELVKEFGDEVVIHSDGSELLTQHIYTDHILELHKAIFGTIRQAEALKENSKTTQ